MIRAALVAALLSTSASAATLAECEALMDRVAAEAETIESIAGVCLFSQVRFHLADQALRADRVSLGGDIDALPDALPRRLSGGVIGLVVDPQIPGFPGMAWLMRQQMHPGMTITFDATSDRGVLRINSFRFRLDDTNEISLSARVAGVPEVWPVDPIMASAMQLQALEAEVAFDGLFEMLILMPIGGLVLDVTQEAEPQVAALRDTVRTFLASFDETSQQDNAQALQALFDALPHPRGLWSIGMGGTGLSAMQAGPLLAGTISPDFILRVADAIELDVQWAPDAP